MVAVSYPEGDNVPYREINLTRTALFHVLAADVKGYDPHGTNEDRLEALVARLNELGDDGAAMREKFFKVLTTKSSTPTKRRKRK